MGKKIYISPSDQTRNIYAYGKTNEAEQCRRIARACEKHLIKNGFTVYNNTTSSMYARVAASNAHNVDLHLCIHTNAFNKKVTGTRVFVWDKSGVGYKIGKIIYDILSKFTPGKSDNISVNQLLYEIKYTHAPCVYCECEFHDSVESAKWIIQNADEIGKTIANGIIKYFGVSEPKKYDKIESYTINTGAKINLKNTNLYSTATSKKIANIISGNYYIWNSDIVNNRIRITNLKNRIGKSGQVTGWIDISNVK